MLPLEADYEFYEVDVEGAAGLKVTHQQFRNHWIPLYERILPAIDDSLVDQARTRAPTP